MTRHPLFLPVLVALAVASTILLGAYAATATPDDRAVSGPDVPATPRPSTRSFAIPVPKHEVYGYVPYWEMDAGIADHLAATDLTTLALFSVTHARSGELATGENGYRRIAADVGRRLIAEAHGRGTRVELVYTSFGFGKNEALFRSRPTQDRVIAGLVALVAELGVDGINVDVEQLRARDVPAYGAFVARLRDALHAVLPDAQVSAATGAAEGGAAMAVAAAAAGADRIFLMGYDYHWAGSEPGASAPLGRRDGSEKTLEWSLDLYRDLGVPADRTLLGLPLYGMTWPVAGPEPDALRVGRGEAWFPRRNLEVLTDPSFVPVRDEIEVAEVLTLPVGDGWQAVYFDSPVTLARKLGLADVRGLAGAGLWAIGYERGLPDYTRLIATFRAGELDWP